jgi:hypothetical protein
MPLPGGPADKLGNRYELWWTISQLQRMLHGELTSIRIEDPGLQKCELVTFRDSSNMLGRTGGRLPHAPDGRTPIPAALRYLPAVSRRTPVSCSMRRNGHPSRPRAITCCLLSSLKTLLIPTKATVPYVGINVPSLILVGRFSGDHYWPVLGDP